MFPAMRRWKQQLTQQACVELLKQEPRGVLSLMGEDGYPYGLPISYWYCEADGKIYFHGAKSGHKIDAIRRCDKASFCVYDQGFRREGEWALNIKSVIVFGRIHPVEDAQKTEEICRNLCAKFNDDPAYAQGEWEKSGAHVRCLALTPEHMTRKQVIES